jgi:hypothetical protein
MQQRTTRVNPSEETIKIGPLGIRFLLTGDDSNSNMSVFEVLVPAGQKLAAPAHKNDAYEAVISPAIMGPAYFREAAEVINATADGPPDPAKMMEVFRRHGMTMAVPPATK